MATAWTASDHLRRIVLIAATAIASWLGMQAVHELGHCVGAWLTGGRVERVVLHPFTISRTDLSENPHPLIVAWAGPLLGTLAPLALWLVAKAVQMQLEFLLRFFAAFCLLANGLYIGLGSIDHIGDCGEMLKHGSQLWQLWLFGLLTAPLGLVLLNKLAAPFGVGPNAHPVSRSAAYFAAAVAVSLFVLGLTLHHWPST